MRGLLGVLLMVFSSLSFSEEIIWQQLLNLKNPPASYTQHAERLRATSILRGDFIQRRNMKVLKNPLISTGKFVYARDMGLLWELILPFESNYIISETKIRRVGAQQTNSQAPDRVMEGISKMLAAMFSGDFKHLERYFDLYYHAEGSTWEIGLVSNKSVVKKLIHKIILRGETHIHSISIFESGGDEVEIKFTSLSTVPPALTSAEKAIFANEQ